MNIKKLQNFYITIFLLLSSLAFAEQESGFYANGYYDEQNDWIVIKWYSPSNKKEIVSIIDSTGKVVPSAKAEIEILSEKNYKYSYVVSNSEHAKQKLKSIYLKSTAKIVNTTTPVPSTRRPWLSSTYRDTQTWVWSSNVDAIPPGGTLSGFTATSEGIPSIVNITFNGKKRENDKSPSPNYDKPEVFSAYDKELVRLVAKYKDKTKMVVYLKTVGPIAPPKDLNPTEFMQGIIDMKHEAQELGWIRAEGGDGIIKALDKKLDNALKAIKSGNLGSAKNILEAFIQQVEAQGCATYDDCVKGKHLMPEAYALLKYNAQYLIDNM